MLERALVSPEVFALRPDYMVTLVEVSGLPSGPSDDESRAQLAASAAHAQANGAERHPHVLAWHDAFQSFGAKPKRTRSSVDALLRRTGAGLPEINRIVDIYNAVSVQYAIPVGGEDPDRYSGPPRLVIAGGGEAFDIYADGELVDDPAVPGEVVWRDDIGVTCRRWNWRQCVRTRITEESERGYFLLERLEPLTIETLDAATADLVERLRQISPSVVVQTRTVAANE